MRGFLFKRGPMKDPLVRLFQLNFGFLAVDEMTPITKGTSKIGKNRKKTAITSYGRKLQGFIGIRINSF